MPAPSALSLLLRNRQLRTLLGARVVSFAGDQVTTVALVLLVHDRYGRGSAVAALLAAQVLPQLAGPLAGTVVDRADQRRVLRVCETARAAVVATIALTLPPLPVLVGLVAINAALAAALRPAGRSAIPALVEAGDLGAANAALASGANVGLALGPLLGGALTAWIGVPGTLLVDVATSLASAVWLRRLRPLPPAITDAIAPAGLSAELREGIRFTWRHPTTRLLSTALYIGVALAGIVLVAGVFIVRDELGGGPAGYGLFTGAWGLGMIGAGLALARSTGPSSPAAWLTAGLAAQAAALLAVGAAPVLGLAIAVATVGGAGNGLQDIATDTILQQHVPRRLLGRAVGAVYAASFAGELTAYAAAGPLVDVLGPRPPLVGAGAGLAGLSIVVAVALHRPGDLKGTSPPPHE